MRTSERGIELIKQFEGFSPTVYVCPAGKKTVGYGHVVRKNETFDNPLTESEATQLLIEDLSRRYEPPVLAMVEVALSQNQFDALVSFVYNVGAANFESSTLLRKLNHDDYTGAADEFLRWTKATVGGVKKELAGLVRRRNAERDLFLEQ